MKAQSGAWFFQGHKQKKGSLFGSTLVRQSLRRYPNNETQPYKGLRFEMLLLLLLYWLAVFTGVDLIWVSCFGGGRKVALPDKSRVCIIF